MTATLIAQVLVPGHHHLAVTMGLWAVRAHVPTGLLWQFMVWR